jgi:hypothetical protein
MVPNAGSAGTMRIALTAQPVTTCSSAAVRNNARTNSVAMMAATASVAPVMTRPTKSVFKIYVNAFLTAQGKSAAMMAVEMLTLAAFARPAWAAAMGAVCP